MNKIIKCDNENNNVQISNVNKIFKTDKLYLYYLTGGKIITSIIECEDNIVRMYNGFNRGMTKFAYCYKGIVECGNNTMYIQMCNDNNTNKLEKVQIVLSIPWISEIDNCLCFVTGLTANAFPVVKKELL